MREIDTAVVRELTWDIVVIPSWPRPGTTNNGIAGDAIDVLKMILRAAVRDGGSPRRKSVHHDRDHAPEDEVATLTQVVGNHDRTAATLHMRRQKNGSTLTDPKSEMGVRSMAVSP